MKFYVRVHTRTTWYRQEMDKIEHQVINLERDILLFYEDLQDLQELHLADYNWRSLTIYELR